MDLQRVHTVHLLHKVSKMSGNVISKMDGFGRHPNARPSEAIFPPGNFLFSCFKGTKKHLGGWGQNANLFPEIKYLVFFLSENG